LRNFTNAARPPATGEQRKGVRIFLDGLDRRTFLRTLHEAWARTGWPIHAYCLMANHFHHVAETPQLNLVAGMKRLPGADTGRFNRRHRYFGHVFSGRYKSLVPRRTRGRVARSSGDGWSRGVA
jgi:REP element-mobilizing transposase RayT